MKRYSDASIQSQMSLSVLNTGQAVIIAVASAAVMVLAAIGIKQGSLKRRRFCGGDGVSHSTYSGL